MEKFLRFFGWRDRKRQRFALNTLSRVARQRRNALGRVATVAPTNYMMSRTNEIAERVKGIAS